MSLMQPHLGTLDYVVGLAKEWTRARFAAARTPDFELTTHRFELRGGAVHRRAVLPTSLEWQSPFDAVRRVRQPTAWTHGAILNLLADSEDGTVQYDQEAVEVLAMDRSDILVEFALVVRVDGLPPCLGPFAPAR